MSDQNEQQNLAACPFCGGRADTDFIDFIEGASYIIECSICGSHTGFEDSPADAIAAWNRRAPAAAPAPVAASQLTDEIMWQIYGALKDSGKTSLAHLVSNALAAVPAAAPIVQPVARPLPTPEQLLAVARDTGLRSFLQGVNATDARELLSVYIDAVRQLDTNYLPAPTTSTADAKDAARAAALEEAALICEEMTPGRHHLTDNDMGRNSALYDAAEKIRAAIATSADKNEGSTK